MQKNILKHLIAAQFLLVSSAVLADTYHFLPTNPNNNNIGLPNAVGSQLTVDVTDSGFGSALFTFTNPVGVSSSITNVWFSDPAPTVFSSYAITSQIGDISFILVSPNPANFPEGGPSFVEVASADAAAEGTNEIPNGINAIGESLTFTAIFNGGNSFASLINSINSGEFRIALQTRHNPLGGNPSTDRWLNDTPATVPTPAAGWLFGTALLGLMGLRRKM